MRTTAKSFVKRLAPVIAALFAVCIAAPASAQTGPTLLQQKTSPDGLLTLSLSSANAADAVNVNNTYTWTATNNSGTSTLTGVVLGSHWGDWCGAAGNRCNPSGPTLVSLAPGCGGQSPNEFVTETGKFGIWCTPSTGVTLLPGQSVSGSVTLRPVAGGPPLYVVYSGYNDPVTGVFHALTPAITSNTVTAPAATDIQISGSASTGSPALGSIYTYTYQVKNAGPWGTWGGIIFVDTLPDSLVYVSSSVTVTSPLTGQSGTLNSCSVVGQTVTCPFGDLQNVGPANQVTVTLNVEAPSAPQQIANTASVHTVLPQTDSQIANNSVTVSVTTK
jgi:uncharacterized repeat protein (TIGR01451 family)